MVPAGVLSRGGSSGGGVEEVSYPYWDCTGASANWYRFVGVLRSLRQEE